MAVLVFLLVKPFLLTILTGIIVAYIFHPVYRRLRKKLKNDSLAAAIVSIFIIFIIAIPLFFIVSQIVGEARINYVLIKQSLSPSANGCAEDNIFCPIIEGAGRLLSDPGIKAQLDIGIERATNLIIKAASNLLLSIPRYALLLFIMLFVIYFTLRDGHHLVNMVKRILPVSQKSKNRIIERINDVTYGVVYGLFFVGLLEGILGGLGFWILGLHSPIFWGIVMMLLAILPVLGPPIVWGPAGLILVTTGLAESNNSLVVKGIILLAYGLLVILPIDMILKPKIVGQKGKLHPVMVVIGVFGGIALFGFVGIILGPVLVSLFVTFIEIYEEEIK